MRFTSLAALSAAALIAAPLGLSSAGAAPPGPTSAGPGQTAGTPSGSFALSGAEAEDFQMPSDMVKIDSSSLPDGRTWVRYQQMVGKASVFGGQITELRDGSGVVSVVGAYFPDLEAKNAVRLSRAEAKSTAVAKVGARGDWSNQLRIDPRTARYFYAVESIRSAERPVRWIDAASGDVIKAYNAIHKGDGIGVKGDEKTFSTTSANGVYRLVSSDGRQLTCDLANQSGGTCTTMTDPDDSWVDNNRRLTSPSQAPGVDAHYYANVVDDFYAATFGRDSIDDKGMQIVSRVHYGRNYCNAFWNGQVMTYGDGDGRGCLALSGGLDVISHELTHGVTDHTSNLIYENQSGALNEAFSDMMGNTAEFYAQANELDPTVEPDWLIGEDVINATTTDPGFRNMGDPGAFDDPDHVVDLYTGTADGGGVHTNSGIPNHAYFLSVKGGQNRGCVATADRPATHTEDCDVTVPTVGLDRTAQIYYAGFTMLPEYANFCDARNSTIANAGADAAAVGLAWDAVGVHSSCTGGTPPPPPCEGGAETPESLPIESPHPYGNGGDCTWTFTNPTAGFTFHFTLLDLEKDYDYLYLRDGNGTVLESYTGTVKRPGFTSPCITTDTASLQLVTDPGVTAQGFTIDAVEPC